MGTRWLFMVVGPSINAFCGPGTHRSRRVGEHRGNPATRVHGDQGPPGQRLRRQRTRCRNRGYCRFSPTTLCRRADVASDVVTATEEFIADLIPEEWFTHRPVGVADDDGLTFVDDLAVDEAGIVVRALTTPTSCLDLHLIALVGKFE